jgi:hypothetical protein
VHDPSPIRLRQGFGGSTLPLGEGRTSLRHNIASYLPGFRVKQAMPKLPDMSKAAVLKREQMVREPIPVPEAAAAPKIRIAQSRMGPATRKKKKKAA